MKQKRIIPLLLAMTLLLSSCGQTEEEVSPEETQAEAGEEEVVMKKLARTEDEAATEEPALTVSEAVNFLMSLSPRILGLDGDTMDGYRVYPAMEVASVDDLTCSKLFVYLVDQETETNVIQGIYLLSRGAERRLFQLDQADGTVTELPLPLWAAAPVEPAQQAGFVNHLPQPGADAA